MVNGLEGTGQGLVAGGLGIIGPTPSLPNHPGGISVLLALCSKMS